MDNQETDYEKRIANPGLCLDPVYKQQQREKALNDPTELMRRKEEMYPNPELKAKEKEYLRNNPGARDIFGVLDESKKR